MRSSNGSSVAAARPPRGRPRPPGGSAWPPRRTTLPWSVCSSRLPSPVTTKAAARIASSKPSASSTKAAPGTSVAPRARPEPARQAAGGAGHRHAARVAREPRGELGEAPLEPLRPCAGSAPFCGPKTRGASSNGVRTSQTHVESRARRRASSSASSAPAPPSVVAEPPTVTITALGPRLHRGGDQLARCRGWTPPTRRARPRPPAPARSPAPSRRSPVRPSSSSANAASTGRPSGSLTVALRALAAERRHERVHRALAAVGHRQLHRLAARRRAARAPSPPPPRARRTCP